MLLGILLLSFISLRAQSVELDRIAAIVNNQPILESDVQQEIRMSTFVPGMSDAQNNPALSRRTARSQPDPTQARAHAINRLIDRSLITAQEQWQQPAPVTDAVLAADIAELQRRLPDCEHSKCATAAGWTAVLRDHGFTPEEFNSRWRDRITMLRFIEQRFRPGAHITREEVETYYSDTLAPQYAAVGATPPPLASISNRIEQLLLEERISTLLDDWLKQLRSEGNVRILAPGEEMP
jgi:peptidyl-prolyl cis-trans isomerase SurA